MSVYSIDGSVDPVEPTEPPVDPVTPTPSDPSYVGCFVDDSDDRVLTGPEFLDVPSMTAEVRHGSRRIRVDQCMVITRHVGRSLIHVERHPPPPRRASPSTACSKLAKRACTWLALVETIDARSFAASFSFASCIASCFALAPQRRGHE